MFATCIGILFLISTYATELMYWLPVATGLLPFAFLLALFMSLALFVVTCLLRAPLTSFLYKTPWYHTLTLPLASIGLLLSLVITTDSQISAAIFLLFFVWIDALCFQARALKLGLSFEGIARQAQHKLNLALGTKDLQKVLLAFDSLSSLCEEVFVEKNMHDIQQICPLMVEGVEKILTCMPRLTLPQEIKEAQTLIDTYVVFQSLIAKRIDNFIASTKKESSDIKWQALIKLVSQMTSLFLMIDENFSLPFLAQLSDCAAFLQKNKSLEELEVYARCVESAKTLLDHALAKKKNGKLTLSPLVQKLEFLMKERFRQDRSINTAYLMQPFAEIANYLAHPSFLSLMGREELISDLKRILSQFAILETISGRMGEVEQTDTSASYKEDIPYLKNNTP